MKLQQFLRDTERKYIADLLVVTSGKVPEAAKLAGCHRVTFWRLIRRHGLRPADFAALPVHDTHPLMRAHGFQGSVVTA